jgi:hypothetical protein
LRTEGTVYSNKNMLGGEMIHDHGIDFRGAALAVKAIN